MIYKDVAQFIDIYNKAIFDPSLFSNIILMNFLYFEFTFKFGCKNLKYFYAMKFYKRLILLDDIPEKFVIILKIENYRQKLSQS